jgi:hypothetical protein
MVYAPVLNNPHTGQPRDLRDVESDHKAILCIAHGEPLKAAQAEPVAEGGSYCLGYTHEKCDTCQHQKNWHTLNELSDTERLQRQHIMVRVDNDKCRLTSMGEYAALAPAQATPEGDNADT